MSGPHYVKCLEIMSVVIRLCTNNNESRGIEIKFDIKGDQSKKLSWDFCSLICQQSQIEWDWIFIWIFRDVKESEEIKWVVLGCIPHPSTKNSSSHTFTCFLIFFHSCTNIIEQYKTFKPVTFDPLVFCLLVILNDPGDFFLMRLSS